MFSENNTKKHAYACFFRCGSRIMSLPEDEAKLISDTSRHDSKTEIGRVAGIDNTI